MKILEEIIVENFRKMGMEIPTHVQETQRVLNKINSRQNTPRHILIKLTKIKHKEQILKVAREKQQITQRPGGLNREGSTPCQPWSFREVASLNTPVQTKKTFLKFRIPSWFSP